jgi:hypothetical protein
MDDTLLFIEGQLISDLPNRLFAGMHGEKMVHHGGTEI